MRSMTGPLQQRGRGFLKAISNPKWGRLLSQVCPLRRRAQMHQPFLAAQLVKGCCARSFTAIRNAPSTSKETSTAAIFPMPLPYPEVFQQRSRGGSPFDRARKKFVVCLVLILNYLHFRRPRSVVGLFAPQQRLTGRQWEVVRHWEFLSDAWFVSQIGPEEMGRTASKVETLEERLSALLSRAHLLHSRADRYFAPSSSPEKTGDPLLKQGACTSKFRGVE